MKQILTLAALVAAILAGTPATQGEEQPAQTFEGSYDWSSGGSDELSAEFTPTGEDSWDVQFRFLFNGKRSTWNGTAEGSLADGSDLTGTATSGSRNWVFSASIEDGVMRGKHTEIRGGSEVKTGTFELER